MGESSWYTIYEKSFECTEEIVEVLMDSQQVCGNIYMSHIIIPSAGNKTRNVMRL